MLRWCLLLLVLMLLIVGIGWGWKGLLSDSPNGTKKVTQSTADTPVYILAVGLDEEAVPAADGLAVLSVNREQEYVTLISLLPETNVAGDYDETPQLLGNAYQAGGIQALKEKVESTLHIFIPYYVVMRMPTAAQWLNSRGKIDFYVERDLYRDNDTGVVVNLRQGFQELSGEKSMEYVRYREDGTSSLARVQRQQRLIKAYLEKLRHHYAWVNYMYAYYDWNPDETNISAGDAADMARFLTNLPEENWHYYITPGQYIATEDGGYWRIDPIAVQNIIGLTLRPDAAQN